MISNFTPPVEKASEEKLYQWIQSTTPSFGILASDELTRRRLGKLIEVIIKADEQSKKLEQSNYRLQIILLILTAISTFIVALPIFKSILVWLQPSVSYLTPHAINVIAFMISVIVGVLSFFSGKRLSEKIELSDSVKVSDSVNIVVNHTNS